MVSSQYASRRCVLLSFILARRYPAAFGGARRSTAAEYRLALGVKRVEPPRMVARQLYVEIVLRYPWFQRTKRRSTLPLRLSFIGLGRRHKDFAIKIRGK
jgi:hypothetical protein